MFKRFVNQHECIEVVLIGIKSFDAFYYQNPVSNLFSVSIILEVK